MYQRERRISFNRKQEECFGHLIANAEMGRAAAGAQDSAGSEEELQAWSQMRKDFFVPKQSCFLSVFDGTCYCDGDSEINASFSEVNNSQLVCNKGTSMSAAIRTEKMKVLENMCFESRGEEKGANMHVSQAYRQQIKPSHHFNVWEWLRYWCELTDRMLFSEPVTSKRRFMQSRGGVEGEGNSDFHLSWTSFKSGIEWHFN